MEGAAKITALMKTFREKAPSVFAGIPVVQTEDFKELTRVGLDGHMQK